LAYVAEIRTTGSDQNGGCFNTGYSGTTDYSQSDTPILSLSDLTTTGSGTTSVSSVTGGFTPDMARNFINIISGTNFVPGLYEITSVTNSNTVVLSKSPTPNGAGSGGVGNVGGALASPGFLAGQKLGNVVAWMRTGTYNISTGVANVSNGLVIPSSSNYMALLGYYQTRGDFPTDVTKMPIIIYTASTSNVQLLGNYLTSVGNIIIDVNNTPGSSAVYSTFGGNYFFVIAKNAPSQGFYGSNRYTRCAAYNCGSGWSGGLCSGCYAESCSNKGFYNLYAASNCIYVGKQASDIGFHTCRSCWNCTSYKAGGTAFFGYGGIYINCLAVQNGTGFNINYWNTNGIAFNCAGYQNTSGNFYAGTFYNCTNLTVNPFVSTSDLSVNAINVPNLIGNPWIANIPPLSFGLASSTTFKRDVGTGQHQDISGVECSQLIYQIKSSLPEED